MSCKCKVFAFNCCDHCCDTSGDIATGAEKSPYIGENGNWFTWNGEEWEDTGVKAGGAGTSTDLPWCSGLINDKSLAANANDIMTPTYSEGDSSMISGNRFKAPTAGLYALHVGGGNLASSRVMWSSIQKNSDIYTAPSVISFSQSTGAAVCFASAIVQLEANEYLTYSLGFGTATSTINQGGASHKFWFARIA